jgi:broad specificity phosphatase PhoE
MNLTLIRHGQAGTRLAYDVLSETGRVQASLLGRYLHASGARFDRWTSGHLQRQRETASLAASEVSHSVSPSIVADEIWNEFDLDRVYNGIAPKLAAVHPEFRAHWEEVQAQVEQFGDQANAAVNRRWSPADEMVVRAWVRGEIEFDGESWEAFRARIRRALASVLETGAESAVVFTSATPTAISVGEALGLEAPDIFQLAGALMNASFTELRWRNGKWRLFSFNNVPHLDDRELRTHR